MLKEKFTVRLVSVTVLFVWTVRKTFTDVVKNNGCINMERYVLRIRRKLQLMISRTFFNVIVNNYFPDQYGNFWVERMSKTMLFFSVSHRKNIQELLSAKPKFLRICDNAILLTVCRRKISLNLFLNRFQRTLGCSRSSLKKNRVISYRLPGD